jgi:hypothetical protein
VKNRRKALFIDLDGTLLTDSKQIPAANREAEEELLRKGHQMIITTGRPLPSAVIQAQRLGLAGEGCFLIAYNGGVLYDTFHKKILFEKTVSAEEIGAITDEVNRRGLHLQAYDREKVLVEKRCDNDIVRLYCRRIEMKFGVIESMHSLKESPKLLVIDLHDRSRMEDLQEWIRGRFDPMIDTFFSSGEYLEIVAKGLNKGNGLRMMAQLLKIPIEDTIAIGDEENDVSMLEAAGIGCAMINGSASAKAAADYITERDNNNGGAAEVMRRFILEK